MYGTLVDEDEEEQGRLHTGLFDVWDFFISSVSSFFEWMNNMCVNLVDYMTIAYLILRRMQ